MAEVWAGEDLVLHRKVAVKVFCVDTPDAGRRIEAEIRTIASLNHPGIVTTYDAGSEPGPDDATELGAGIGPYLVMELVDGATLADRLRVGPLPDGDARALAVQLGHALGYLHGRGVVHRDVKPANILLQPPATNGGTGLRARLTDFGTARVLGSTRITMAGLTLGTANYLSPEQANGREVGPPTDVYSLGLVLIETLTGHVAFPGFGIPAAAARLHHRPDLPAALGPQWTRLLDAMTADDASSRPTADEVADEVAGWPTTLPDIPVEYEAAARPTGSTAMTRRSRRSHRSRRLAALWIALATVVLAAGAVLVLALAQGEGTPLPSPATTSTVSYPSVPGPIGRHLLELESAVG
jgi:serine/threonine protein kinase